MIYVPLILLTIFIMLTQYTQQPEVAQLMLFIMLTQYTQQPEVAELMLCQHE